MGISKSILIKRFWEGIWINKISYDLTISPVSGGLGGDFFALEMEEHFIDDQDFRTGSSEEVWGEREYLKE